MIRTLQKKFILTAMIAVTVLLGILLGAVNAVNAWTSRRETDRLLNALVQMEAEGRKDFRPGGEEPPDFPDGNRPGGEIPPFIPEGEGPAGPGGFLSEALTDNDRMGAVYFTVRLVNGTVEAVDVSRISSVSESEAARMGGSVWADGSTAGRLQSFRYAAGTDPRGGTVYVFLENSLRRNAVLRVTILSALAGLVCWGLMLLLVILLSRRVIAPIAANMERQRQFVTDAGHELKTPLSIIQANTEAMELITGENKWSRNIKAQVLRLTDLTGNLLTLARAEESPNEASFTKSDFSAITEQTVKMFQAPIELRNLRLEADVTPGQTITGNRSQLSSLCSILLDNAVKYAAEGSLIRLELKKVDKTIRLRVENECEHLPDCPPDRLFDRFYRGDTARTQSSGGFGIGLPAARIIAEQHRGKLNAEYLRDQRIAFTVTLPAG